jgi:tetratricopeptide (TPR) repeat protein
MRIDMMALMSLLMASRAASASPKEDERGAARFDVQRASSAFNLGHYAEAAGLYEQAYELVPDPILLYDIGQCYRLANELDDALLAYRSYLRTSPKDAPNRDQVERMIDDLEWAKAASRKDKGWSDKAWDGEANLGETRRAIPGKEEISSPIPSPTSPMDAAIPPKKPMPPALKTLPAIPKATDREAAREDVRQALAAFGIKHYAEAASLYERAYRRMPDPILLYDVGQCRRLAGEPGEALIAYRSFLKTSSDDDPNRDRVEQVIADLEWSQATSHLSKKIADDELDSLLDLTAPIPKSPKSPRTPWKSWAPWIGTGITSVLAMAAIAESISFDSDTTKLQNSCGKTKSCTNSQLGTVESDATAATALWVLSAASAATTGVLFYLDHAGGKGAGLSLSWRY